MSELPELEVNIRFKYTPDSDNYEHLEEVTTEGIIETDLTSFKEDAYVLSDYLDDADVSIVEADQDNDEYTFYTKPHKIKAVKWTGYNINEIWDMFGVVGIYGPTEVNLNTLVLTTADNNKVNCTIGSWVIPDNAEHTFYPCNDDHFSKKYEQRL